MFCTCSTVFSVVMCAGIAKKVREAQRQKQTAEKPKAMEMELAD